jgi:thymidylate synthase (FAD)
MDILVDVKKEILLYENKGGVLLVDCSPRICPEGRKLDFAAVRAARTSYGSGLKTIEEDTKLVKYLVSHDHTSPLEFITFTFKITCPIFVARQIMRHRTASINEISARYTKMKDVFFIPDKIRMNITKNKQSSDGEITEEKREKIIDIYENMYKLIYKNYEELLSLGVCREQARAILPVGLFTEFYITMNMNNLLKFLKLRMASDAQYETQLVAKAMYELTYPLCPNIYDAHNKK